MGPSHDRGACNSTGRVLRRFLALGRSLLCLPTFPVQAFSLLPFLFKQQTSFVQIPSILNEVYTDFGSLYP